MAILDRLEQNGTELVPAGQEIERRMLDGYEVMTFSEMAMRAMRPAGHCPARNRDCR
jgi:hypothetical protein